VGRALLRRVLSCCGSLTLLGTLMVVAILVALALAGEVYNAMETPTNAGYPGDPSISKGVSNRQ
jgi:hypothetical protein